MNCYFVGMVTDGKPDFLCMTVSLFTAQRVAKALNVAPGLDYVVFSGYGFAQYREMSDCVMDVVQLPYGYFMMIGDEDYDYE